jgi:diguanylate cyclase (GGDEF)-like protein
LCGAAELLAEMAVSARRKDPPVAINPMPHRPLRQTVTSRVLAAAARHVAHWPRQRVWLVALGALLAIMILNYFTGPNVSLLALYMLLATFVGWCLGERAGFLFALLCVASGVLIRRLDMSVVTAPALAPMHADLINAAGRLLSIMFTVVVVNGLRAALDMERWLGSIDSLTGALNKIAFEDHMRVRLREARRSELAVVLAYIDLDGFKQVNDTLRHRAGDEVLQGFASRAMATLRAGDLFARVGGDEFAALLTARDEAEGVRAAQEFHQRLSHILHDQRRGVTCSTGAVIAAPVDDSDGAELLEAADRLMYAVKENGKDGLSVEVIGRRQSIREPGQVT